MFILNFIKWLKKVKTKQKKIQSLTMIPIPAVCENDLLACCGFNEFWDRSMTAVKSGKLEKHRKDYLFNKKRKREKKKKQNQ